MSEPDYNSMGRKLATEVAQRYVHLSAGRMGGEMVAPLAEILREPAVVGLTIHVDGGTLSDNMNFALKNWERAIRRGTGPRIKSIDVGALTFVMG